MDRLTAPRLLEVAEKRAREATERTTRQRELVARLEGQLRRMYDEAHELLKQFELSERVLLQECDRLRSIRDQPLDEEPAP
jgi:hypothetical protein